MEEDPIVYVTRYKGYVTVTRTKSGEWNYNYFISDIFKRANRNRALKDRLFMHNKNHLWDVGQTFGVKMAEIIEECKKSYGE